MVNKATGATRIAQNVSRTGKAGREHDQSSAFRSWLIHHRACFLDGLRRLLNKPLSSFLSLAAVAIALALPALFFILVEGLTDLSRQFDREAAINVYASSALGELERTALAKQLKNLEGVAAIRYTSAEEGLKEFADATGLSDIALSLDSNPLPDVFAVSPDARDNDPRALQELSERLKSVDKVEDVVVDMLWIQRLDKILILLHRGAWFLGFILFLGLIIVVGNTIRLAVEDRRVEIEVCRLIGATSSYIRRPFLYLGFWYGLIGALLALSILAFASAFLGSVVDALLTSYALSDQSLGVFSWRGLVYLVLIGLGASIFAAILAVQQQLSV